MLTDSGYDLLLANGNAGIYKTCVIGSAVLGGFLIRQRSLAWRMPGPMSLTRMQTIWILVAAAYGAIVGSTIPAFLAGGWIGESFTQFLQNEEPTTLAWLMGPKTVIGGLLLSFLFVAGLKKIFRLRYDTSDDFALPAVVMMAIGRWGCVFQHCCFGRETKSEWGVDLGDGHLRYPVQIAEAILLSALVVSFWQMEKNDSFKGRRLFLFFSVYGALRFFLEFFREPIAATIGPFGFYQWLSLAVLATGLLQTIKRTSFSRKAVAVS